MAKVLTLFPWSALSADNFEAFWSLYPRRVAKLDAQRAWARLTAQDRAEVLRRLPLFLDVWRHTKSERRYILHPATFLNGRRWEDEIEGDVAPLRNYGCCEWNKNGTRDPGKGRCDRPATHETAAGQVYCEAHAVSLGLVRRKA
jgi:predicted Fe-S protein YdhL (DUF1289 family)